VVRAGGRPEAVLRSGGADGLEDLGCIGVVFLRVGQMLSTTPGQRASVLAEKSEDVPQRP
jgi:hypothetical protein